MHYPKVKFEIVPLDLELEMFNHFLSHRFASFREIHFATYPELINPDIDVNLFVKNKWSEIKRKNV